MIVFVVLHFIYVDINKNKKKYQSINQSIFFFILIIDCFFRLVKCDLGTFL